MGDTKAVKTADRTESGRASGRPGVPYWVIFAFVVESAILVIMATGRIEAAGSLDHTNIFFRLFLEDWPLAAGSVVLLIIAPFVARRAGSWVQRMVWVLNRHPVAAAATFVAFASLAARLIYHAWPLSMDEYAAVFQANIFATGRLMGRIPPALLNRISGPGVLGYFFSANPETGQIVSNYWPGFALLLAPFVRASVPYVLNPVIGGLTLIALSSAGGSGVPKLKCWGWAVLFTIASPMFIVNSMSYYSMPAHLLANTLFALLLIDPTRRRLLLAGLVGSFALTLHNPFPHVLFALPWIAYTAFSQRGIRRMSWLLAGYLPLLVVLFGGWILVSGVVHANGPVEGTYQSLRADSSVVRRAIEILQLVFRRPTGQIILVRIMEITKLFVWTVPALVIVAFARPITAELSRIRGLLLALAAVTVLGYVGVGFSQGHGWGDRYFYPAFMVLPIVAAGHFADSVGREDMGEKVAYQRSVMAVLTLGSFVVLNGAGLSMVGRFVKGQLAQLPVVDQVLHQVVVIDVTKGYYAGDLVQNDPFLRDPVIWIAGWGDGTDSAWVASRFPGARIIPRPQGATVWKLDR